MIQTIMNRREKLIEDQLLNGEKYFYKNISVDNVIFGYHNKELKTLLLRPTGMEKWLLPGGYVYKSETLESAANRIVRYRTQLKDIKLVQFKCFSHPERTKDPFFTPEFLNSQSTIRMELSNNHWLLDNFISVAFFALTEHSIVNPRGDYYAEECEWWDINNLPILAFDHETIIMEALKSMKFFAHQYPIGRDLLPEKFTIPEIHSLYETILNKKIDIRNFTKKLLSINLIAKLEEKKNIGKHRSPYLYKFDEKRYKELISGDEILVF